MIMFRCGGYMRSCEWCEYQTADRSNLSKHKRLYCPNRPVEVDTEKEMLREMIVRLEMQLLHQNKVNSMLLDQIDERFKFLERLLETMTR